MHIAVVNFGLKNMTEEEYNAACDALAPAFAAAPGLLGKVWLSDPSRNTYGGVYTWRDRAAFESFAGSDLARGVIAHPNFTNVVVRDFAVLEGPTRLTRGLR